MVRTRCVNNWCILYNDVTAVCSYSDVCFPEETMNKSQDTKKWKAEISVDLTPINQYGDELGGSELKYTVYLTDTLINIITKLGTLEG